MRKAQNQMEEYITKTGKRTFQTSEGIIYILTPEAMESVSNRQGRIPIETAKDSNELAKALIELNKLGYDIKPVNGRYVISTEIERKLDDGQDAMDISELLSEEKIDPEIPIIDDEQRPKNPRTNRRDSSGIYLRKEFFSSQ